MHWTALLAYRRFPSNARVIDDMGCIGCGYNLRGLLVSGRCPECGGEVGDSVFLLAEPEIVARGLREIGQSFLAFLAMVIGCAGWSAGWMPMFAAGLMTLSAGWRVVGIAELRHRGAIGRLPVVGPRLANLWWCSLANLGISLTWLVALIAASKVPSLQTASFDRVLVMIFMCWLITAVLCAALAGWMGIALATMLGYGWLATEFRLQILAVALCIPAGAIFAMLQASAWPIANLLCIAIFVYAVTAFAFSGVAMMQLGSAAFSENETWEDAVDQQRIAIEPSVRAAEPAPIELAPVPLDPPKPARPIKHATVTEKPTNKPPGRTSDP